MKGLRIASFAGLTILMTSLACNDATAPVKRFRPPSALRTCGNQERPALEKGSTTSPPMVSRKSLSPSQVKPQHGFDPSDECVSAETQEQQTQLLEEFATAQTPDMPLWYGGDIAWPEEGNGTECPPIMSILTIKEYIPEYDETATFTIVSTPNNPIEKVQDLGPDEFGFEMAKYRVPETIFNSKDGKYSIYGGTASVACYHKTWWVWGVNLGLDVKLTLTWNYEGLYGSQNPIRRNGVSLLGGDAGWAYSSNGTNNGYGTSWEDALDAYLSTGSCTYGWSIFVDAVQRCDVDGTKLNQT